LPSPYDKLNNNVTKPHLPTPAKLRQMAKSKHIRWISLVAVFAVIGVIALTQSSAATYSSALEAESGTVSGSTTPVDDNGASGGKSIKFGSSPGGGGGGGGGGVTFDIAAAGDIAQGSGAEAKTAKLVTDDHGLKLVLALGDLAYENGSNSDFMNKYDPTWGQFRIMTRPTPGNHEYQTNGASGYYEYFHNMYGEYYSFDMNGWHFISLNSNIARTATSTQVNWLKQDLQQHQAQCTIAFWHHPRFSSGDHGDDSSVVPFYQALYDANADLILTGHSHNYERYAASKPDGSADSARGIRSFVVGTGGGDLDGTGSTGGPLEKRDNSHFGVIKLTLNPTSYDWKFVDTDNKVLDQGSQNCH
jgi:hypothetical protein